MGQSFDLLPAAVRAQRYREMAVAACDLADSSPSLDSKAEYLKLAGAWQRLAAELEVEISADSRSRRAPVSTKTYRGS